MASTKGTLKSGTNLFEIGRVVFKNPALASSLFFGINLINMRESEGGQAFLSEHCTVTNVLIMSMWSGWFHCIFEQLYVGRVPESCRAESQLTFEGSHSLLMNSYPTPSRFRRNTWYLRELVRKFQACVTTRLSSFNLFWLSKSPLMSRLI